MPETKLCPEMTSPSVYPPLAVGRPTVRQNEKVSPGYRYTVYPLTGKTYVSYLVFLQGDIHSVQSSDKHGGV